MEILENWEDLDTVYLAERRIYNLMGALSDSRQLLTEKSDSLMLASMQIHQNVEMLDSINMVCMKALEENARQQAGLDSVCRKLLLQGYLNDKLVEMLSTTGKEITLGKRKLKGEEQYYFMDKYGNILDSLGFWDKALEFAENGYSVVQMGKQRYLLRKDGTTFRVAAKKKKFKKGETGWDGRYENARKIPFKVTSSGEVVVILAERNRIRSFYLNSIFDRSCIEEIRLADNYLKDITPLTKVPALKVLGVERNRLRKIPSTIGHLLALEELNLSGNQITSLPGEMRSLKTLRVLKLEYNRLDNLGEIGALKRLEFLELSFNDFKFIPPEVFDLPNLTYLGLTGNNISYKDSHFFQMLPRLKNLKVLRIGDNPCSDSPEERQEIRKKVRELFPECLVIFN